MAEIGDIVLHDGHRFVIQELIGNAKGTQDARLIRPKAGNEYVAFLKDADWLTPVESAPFEAGERVRVNKLHGTFQSAANGIANVWMDEEEKPLEGGGKLQIDAALAAVPIWLLVLENREL